MLDYAFYTDVYHGSSVPAESFPYYESRAEDQLDYYKRVYTVEAPNECAEKKAICAMMDAVYGFDQIINGGGGPVQSASIGSVSESFGSSAANAVDVSAKGQAKELYRCARLYLNIYRGVS